MQLKLTVGYPQDWLANLADQLNIEVKDHQLTLPKHLGQGKVQFFSFCEGLHLGLHEIFLNEPWVMIKEKSADIGLYPIIFQNTEAGIYQEIDGQRISIGRNTPNGIIVPSHKIQSKVYLPHHLQLTTLIVLISQDWIKDYIQEDDQEDRSQYLKELFLSQKPYFVYESLTPKMTEIISNILTHQPPASLKKLYLQGKVMELLALLFDKLLKRAFDENYPSLNTDDVEVVFAIRQFLLENIDNPPKISDLAREVAMSESKLKKIFKQIFGYSIYQYILLNRMQKAKSLFDTKRYNVSEVGNIVGYSNLAHFAKAFRKQYNISPSNYLASIR